MCREAKILLVMSALFTFAMGLSGIFVNIFFWKQTSSFIIIVTYNLIHYITTPITFIIGGIIAKVKNGIWSLRIGLLLYALFFALLLFLGSKGVEYIYLLGVVYGFASGFYWLAYNTLTFDFTHVNNRDTFNGYNGCYSGIAAAISPITAGYIISRFISNKGYNIVFTITLLIFLALFCISLLLKCNNYGSKVDYKVVFSRNSKEWSIIRKAVMIWSFRDVIIGFLVSLLIIEATNSELSLGETTLIASLVSSGAYVLVQKIIKPPHRKKAIYIGAIGSFIAVLGIVFKVTYSTLLIFVIIDGFFLPFFIIQLNSATFNVISRSHDEGMRIEYMINKDLAINGGRIISAVILIALISMYNTEVTIRGYLLFISMAPLLSGYFLTKLTEVLEGKLSKDKAIRHRKKNN